MRIDILGPVQVRVGDGVVEVPRRVERALLAVLALHAGHVVDLDTLVEGLWAEDPPATATRSLRSHMSRLRQRLGADIGRPVPGGYRMALDGASTDAGALQDLVSSGATARREGALLMAREAFAAAEQLWRGRPLEDLADGPAKTAQVQRLEGLWCKAREGRLSVDLDLGRHELVADEARDIVAGDPLHEWAWRLLVLAQYRSGRRIDALRSYQRMQGLLTGEWGVDPSPTLQRLYWQMLRQDRQLNPCPPSPPLMVPAAVSSFVGRVGQVETVAGALARDRLVTLHGPPGVGKSRLAQEVAPHVLGRFPDGVWWVDLTAANDLRGVLARLVGALGVSPALGSAAHGRLSTYLRHREQLLVLDNCEHVAAPLAPVVVDLLHGAAGLRVLATSRVFLEVAGESRWEVPPLRVPEPGATEESMSAADSVVLFQQRRGRVVDHPAVNTVSDVADLCRRVDGVPLALELVAAQADHQSIEEINAGLGAGVLDLSAHGAEAAHHRSVRSAIDWGYSELDADDQHLFDRLAVFPGEFDLPAAQALATGAPGPPRDEVLDSLVRLVRASMVQAGPDRGTTMYRLLFVMREYAADRLAERGETEEAHRAFADRCRRQGMEAVHSGSGSAGRTLLGPADLVNLREAFEWSVENERPDRCLEFIVVMGRFAWGPFLDIGANLSLLRELVEKSVEAPNELRGAAWLSLVTAAYLVGEAQAALDACDRAWASFNEVGNRAGLAAAAHGRGVAQFLAVGDLPAAEASFGEGQRLAHEAGAPDVEAWSLAHWVQLQCYAAAPTEQTHQLLAQAQQLCGDSGDPLLALQLAQDEATLAYCEQDMETCIHITERLEALSVQAGAQAIWGQVALLFRGVAILGKGEPDSARSILLRAACNELEAGSPVQLEIFLQALSRVADEDDPVRAARLWGAGTVHAPVWPGLARFWFPSRARQRLGARLDHEVAVGRALSPKAAFDLAVG